MERAERLPEDSNNDEGNNSALPRSIRIPPTKEKLEERRPVTAGDSQQEPHEQRMPNKAKFVPSQDAPEENYDTRGKMDSIGGSSSERFSSEEDLSSSSSFRRDEEERKLINAQSDLQAKNKRLTEENNSLRKMIESIKESQSDD
eukprot:scaffold6846_cov107-Cylindrotheca_fusiformis.AAC.5